MRRCKTLTPRFYDFEKKSDCFAVYNYHEVILLSPPLSPEPPAREFVNALLEPEYQAFLGKTGKMEAKKGES